MEQKIIGFNKGIRRNPTSATEGELVECVNLISKNGEIVNAPTLQGINITVPTGYTAKYIHNTSDGDIYILYKDGNVYYMGSNGVLKSSETIISGITLKDITSVGNILIVTGVGSIDYCLWENNAYTLLRNHIPELTLNFNLTSETIRDYGSIYETVDGDTTKLFDGTAFVGQPVTTKRLRDDETIEGVYWFTQASRGGDGGLTWASNLASFNTGIQGAIAKIIERSTSKNRFIMPFFVRYAFKMYDGSNIMASAPILMVPSSGLVPFLQWYKFKVEDNKIKEMELMATTRESTLEVCAINQSELTELNKWKDIIKGVDIFVSRPFYRHIPNGGANKVYTSENSADDFPICVIKGASTQGDYFTDDLLTFNQVVKVPDQRGSYSPTEGYGDPIPGYYGLNTGVSYYTGGSIGGTYFIPVPHKTQKEFEEEIKTCNNFYHIKYYPITDVPTIRSKVEIKDGVLSSLATQKTLVDDYQSHDMLVPNTMKVLNGRLTIGNYNRVLFDGFNPYAMFAYSQGIQSDHSATPVSLHCVVYIKRNGKFYKVTSATATAASDFFSHPKYIYYPDICAFSVEVYLGSETRVYKLSEHEGLNGAYYFSGLDGTIPDASTGDVPINVENKANIVHENYVCTSNVNNPYVFEAKNYSKVGNGKIKALEVNTAALSQGQFGQHPMIAFASDGIWALEINSEGEFASVQPISREVLLDGTKPCQTDGSVVFATVGGLKGLVGSQIDNISKELDGMIENNSSFFGLMTDWSDLNKPESVLFNKLLEDCQLLFDDANKLIHLYSAQLNGMHYVMSMESGEWSRMTGGTPDSIIPGYPFSTVQKGPSLKQYKKSNDDSNTRLGLLLTRETSFDNPLAVKMLHWVRVMRKKQTDNLKLIVYVSEDRSNWMRLTSFRKHSYKWYRFALFTKMTDVDAVEGIVCGTEERRTNRPR